VISGNHITLLRNGTEYFPALEQAIDAAQHEIHLQTYIFEPDTIGLKIADAMKNAARRGVLVCLLLDGHGCSDMPAWWVHELLEAGIHVLFYRPRLSNWSFKRNRLRRLHRKVAVVDGSTAFLGGINIIDDMNTPSHSPPRVDYAVRVQGALVADIQRAVYRLWRRIAWRSLHHEAPKLSPPFDTPPQGSMNAALVLRDNALHRHDIESAYLQAIDSAHSEIIIANAYFLPGMRFRYALARAVNRRVRVVLLLQERVEFRLLNMASKALYGSLLEAGVEIHEFRKSQMHSKVAVIDGHWATVGSSNIDPFSLLLALEANVVVQDRAFAESLHADLEIALTQHSRQVHRTAWKNFSVLRRTSAWLGYGLVRLAMGLVGISDRE
jgi:cardiolipin synthase